MAYMDEMLPWIQFMLHNAMLNTLWTLELSNVTQLFIATRTYYYTSEEQILFNDLCMRQL